jgi:hypothetical protein
MTFASPAFLWALAAASLPLLLHLVRKRRIRVIRWAAWQFLAISQQKLRRRLRIEQLLLAAIRALIIALIVLAFAQPVARTANSARSGEGPIHAVVALDNSASMGYERDGKSDFARAKEAADTVVARTLKQGDTVSVVLISSAPQVLVKYPSHDLEAARRTIRNAALSGHATRYSLAAQTCAKLCEASRSARKEVFLITDSQRSGFAKAPDSAGSDAWRRLASMAKLTWISAASDDRPNASVLAPVVSRDFVTPGVPVRIEADVVNRTGEEIGSTVARLEVEGRAAGATALRIRPNATARASFTHTFGASGARTGRIVLDRPDGLATDNASWFAVNVRKAMRALVVGPGSSGATAADTLYVATALAPAGASEGAASHVMTTVAPRVGQSGAPLSSFDIVILVGSAAPSGAEMRALQRYVSAGGGLLAFPATGSGGGLAPLWSGDAAISAARLGARLSHSLAAPASLDPATVNHPALAVFRTSEETELGSARITVRYDLSLPSAGSGAHGPPPHVALRFSDGRPALVAGTHGSGAYILSAFPAGIGGGDLPLKAAYVPLLHQLAAHLAASDTGRRMITVGGACAFRFALGAGAQTFSITRGGPEAGERVVAGLRGAAGADSTVLRCPPAARPGIYAVRGSGADPAIEDAYAANIERAETDLAVARPDLIGSHTASIPLTFARAGDNIEGVVRSARYGRELWGPLLLAALALMALETAMSRSFGRRS